MTKFEVQPNEVGHRLDVVVAARLEISRSQAARLIKTGVVKADRPLKSSDLVTEGQHYEVHQASLSPQVNPLELPIVYEDADLFIINKPPGVLVHSGSGPKEFTVADFAKSRVQDSDMGRPGIVHRLDRNTSGLLIIAKHMKAKEYLQSLFKDRRIKKTYTALVVGHPEPPAAKIDLPLDRSLRSRVRRAVTPAGKVAVTVYRTTADYPGYALVEAEPHTGRTHQIRAHLAAIGHPVAGDELYGAPEGPVGLKRQFLHASRLEFTGPSGQAIDVFAPLPTDLNTVLAQLKEVY